MTITFFSNFLNDHQLPLCQAMMEQIGVNNFRFVALQQIDPERVAMGFTDMNEIYPFVVQAYKGGKAFDEAAALMLASDIVIIGSDRGMPYDERIKSGKLTFRYNERLLKHGDWRALDPRVQMGVYRKFGKYKGEKYPFYVLCASAYTSRDLRLFGFPKSKCIKWGYFPIVKEFSDIDELIKEKESNNTLSILWAGRFIDWKHPEIPVQIAKRLKSDHIQFQLNMIGMGDMFDAIKKMIDNEGLSDCVRLLGAMPPADVRSHMEKANIFLFTSDKGEGWGAVLNESMNSACVVVADDSIGSVPFMLRDGVNGFTYHKGNTVEMYKKLMLVVGDKPLRQRIGADAYRTMTNFWNARVAVGRFLKMVNDYQGLLNVTENYGPCSKL